jgi:hypothetical protein
VKADIIRKGYKLGDASDAHAQMIMGNGVIIPPHKFKQLSCWYYRLQKVKKYEFAVFTYGIISVRKFINFRPAILQ